MEKIYVGCSKGRIQEITSRTVVIPGDSFFSMKKVYEQNNEQKYEEKKQKYIFFVALNHIMLVG